MGRTTYFMMPDMIDDDYETVTKTRQVNLDTDLSTLDALFDSGKSTPVVHRKIRMPAKFKVEDKQ